MEQVEREFQIATLDHLFCSVDRNYFCDLKQLQFKKDECETANNENVSVNVRQLLSHSEPLSRQIVKERGLKHQLNEEEGEKEFEEEGSLCADHFPVNSIDTNDLFENDDDLSSEEEMLEMVITLY